MSAGQSNSARLVLFACEQRIESDAQALEELALAAGYVLRVVPLPCSSALEPAIVLRAFEEGVDAIEVLACRPEICRLGDGSRRAARRMSRTNVILAATGIGANRLLFRDGEGSQGAAAALAELIETARVAGPSPLRKGLPGPER
ncbi:MAG: hydrogenase iron-sulfur subunit [Chloroflexi bacterium]|nr:hydrogenase iron-sulfur subunit [Chloroflexota bacterium]